MVQQHISIDNFSPPEAKIALFRSLFRGRDDVYPRRFESRKTGKSGYSPACANEWVQGVCEKPRIKCFDCLHKRFLPITSEVIRWHLSGHDDTGRDFVMGVYPMLLDETCFFLAIDLDKAHWQEDACAVLETCHRLHLSAALERSRSGNGGHIWLFFKQAIPATVARKLGAHLLTETMERRPDIGLDSYDRFFPNQDTLPRGGFGNLIALPLQRRPRESGNSVFLNQSGVPHSDQWAYLASVPKIARSTIEEVVATAEKRGRVVGVRLAIPDEDDSAPWTLPPSRRRNEPALAEPLPDRLELILGNQIYFAKDQLPPGLRNRLIRLAAFQNPEFYKAQAMRLPTYGKPRVVACAEDHPLHIGLPRGCLDDAQKLLADLGIEMIVRDERMAGIPLDVKFLGELQPGQLAAAEAVLAHETGVLSAPTAFGKTVIAAWLIARRGVNTLVLVHRRQLLEQWLRRLEAFLGLPPDAIGRFGGGGKKRTSSIDVALIQSIVRKGIVNDLVGEYGHIIVDECHHLPAQSFEQVVRRSKAKFVTGLSATVARKDGHHPIIFMQCGPVRCRVDAKQQAAARPFEHTVRVRPTGFHAVEPSSEDMRIQFQEFYSQLVADDARNRVICGDVQEAVRHGRSPLVLTERNDHLDDLAERLSTSIRHLVVLRGGMRQSEIRAVIERLATIPETEDRALLATGKYIGEGFDDARLDTLFLALPISWRGTVAQYVGRLHRLHHRKREVQVYDYADLNVPMLARMFDRRCRGYEAVGYQIQLPASAAAGWPVDVPLPVDPEWKRDYSASVRRLIRDGVDLPLANLFASSARSPSADAEGADRARSATEPFLFRRLETLPDTRGRFRLNAALPIPFDQVGQMEVDLLCADARVAVELDGSQHLDGADAYRRDRRKDLLLQEGGYFVLRFLAEDVGKHLDAVLDAILRTLSSRRPRRE
ncbi:MAG TPA: DEAD/DEAH box helicase family protein [Pirellulales bacterium]|jgi:superfamily II DNA or RNA helicase|nr:DEAD/DEAH box helicase family protein [Pirellulales bacterium]